MLNNIIFSLPTQPGSYALWLHLDQSTDLTVGRLGIFAFPAGDYVYLGSANGPGGLRARVGRHLRGNRKPHWHIDYLRAEAIVRGLGFAINCSRGTIYRAPTTMECNWSQKVAALSKAKIIAPGFGVGDCQSGCAAHLVHFSTFDIDQISQLLNCEIRILRAD